MPVTLAEAKAFVNENHRHHRAPVGHKFSIGLAHDDELVGVAQAGRPVARAYDDGMTLEVNRTCVLDGVANGNSMLYGTARKIAKAMGYARLITYTQEGESGASLRAVGWTLAATRPARQGWSCASRERDDHGTDGVVRFLWESVL